MANASQARKIALDLATGKIDHRRRCSALGILVTPYRVVDKMMSYGPSSGGEGPSTPLALVGYDSGEGTKAADLSRGAQLTMKFELNVVVLKSSKADYCA